MFFLLSFIFFLLQKSENRRAEQVLPRVGAGHKYCIHMYVNAKMIPVETVPGIWVGGMKESSGGRGNSI
jgi:hypothetical protein